MIDAILLAAAVTFPTLTQIRTGAPPLPANPTTTNFTFVVAGDNRPADPNDKQTTAFKDILDRIAATPPAFVVWNGDTIYGKDASVAGGQYKKFRAEFAKHKVNVPLFDAPGNHELALAGSLPCGKKDKPIDQPDPSGKLLGQYTQHMGPPYGMFRYGNAAFLAVNTDDTLDVTAPDPCAYNGFVGKAQLDALQATLAQLSADPSVTHIFLFMHRPLHDTDPSGKPNSHQFGPHPPSQSPDYDARLLAFIAALDIPAQGNYPYPKMTFVFSSHDHRLFVWPIPSSPNGPFSRTSPSTAGPTFVTTGGGGAPLAGCKHHGTGDPGAWYHSVSVTVDGSSVKVTVNPLNGTTNCGAAP